MSETKRKVPKLRFPGFTEDWEQRKLSELATMNARIGWQNLRTSEFLDDGEYLLITGTDFDNGRIKYDTCHYVEKERYEQDKKIQLNSGSILITKDGTLGKVALIEDLPKPATLNAGVFNVRVKNNELLSYRYLFHYLKAPFLMKYVVANATGGTIKHLNQSILVDFPIPFPTKGEQDEISKILDALDTTITLHQRKLENLKLKKKALLQKLFPKNGEQFPELRFPGFTDAWEQRKLSELATMNARIGWQNLRTSEFLDDGEYLLITGTDFDNGRIKYDTCHYVEKERYEQDKKIQLNSGSILITKDGTLGKVALIEDLPKPATLNAGVFNVRVKNNELLSYRYLFHYLKAPFLMKYVVANATGGTIKHLNQSILVDFPIPFPTKGEQDEISKILDALDTTITLHQRKLEHLQLQKKALLQQMFV